jgi:YVTN family beta-propeller protein
VLRVALGLLHLLAVFNVSSVTAANENPVTEPSVVGHRGLLQHAPENTIAGFRACLELRLGFELDVRRSSDGVLICIHDETLDRTTTGKGMVADQTLAELKKLDAGAWFHADFREERIPTLEEVFALLAKSKVPVLIAIDLKADDDRLEADVVGMARKHDVLDRLLFIGRAIDHPDVRRRIRAADPAAHLACVASTPEDLPAALADKDSDWAYVRHVVSRAEVEQVHKANKRVFVAGPKVSGREETNWRALSAAGVDGLLTDFPLEFRQQERSRHDAQGFQSPRLLPSRQFLLPNGWAISPAGRQVELGGLPLNLLAVPGSRYFLVTSNGYTDHFLAVVDAEREQVVQRVPIAEGWLGLASSSDGKRVYASAGSKNVILMYDLNDGRLAPAGEIPLEKGTFPAGLHLGASGQRLYVTGNLSNSLLVVDLKERRVVSQVPVGNKPYTCVVTANEKMAYVSNWGEESVAQIDLAAKRVVRNIKVQDRPNDLLLTKDEKHVFVPNGNRNTVSVIDTARGLVIEQIDVALVPGAPLGSTPNSLALSADGKTLLVASADNNALAVIDVAEKGHSQPQGFIPTGWYPTAVRYTADGKKLIVANGKGGVSRPTRFLEKGDKPSGQNDAGKRDFDYIGRLLEGSLSFIDTPDRRTLPEYSWQVHRNTPAGRRESPPPAPPFPLGKECPIRYVFYIIKENRTYDCVFGDMREGHGDPAYCLFPEPVTPNHHALAREFVLLDNFYHDAEVSADGHHWVTSAYASDYVEKFWPAMYAGRGNKERLDLHDDPVAFSKGGFLWDLCARAGLSYRSYGEFARLRGAEPGQVRAAMPSLEGHIHPRYFGADGISAMSDSKRLELWLAEFREFEKKGEMPRFTVLSLPGDHLLGTRPGGQTPRAMMAENDLALGKMIEAISRSRFWKETVIFVVEDDAQNGPDHIDCHRTVALAVSPYIKRGQVDSTMYSTSSMLGTMELLLGLPPLTQFDAAATPMWPAFQAKPDLRPYAARQNMVPLDEKNTAAAYGAQRSLAMSLDEADTADDLEYSALLWKAVKGANSTVPPRRVATFVLERGEVEEAEDSDLQAPAKSPRDR